MTRNEPSSDLIQATVADLREVISRLKVERGELDIRLDELNERCRDWERILQKTSSNGSVRKRAKKGENERKIAQAYQNDPDRGFTLPELESITGIPWSSVRNVMKRNGQQDYEEVNGTWRIREAQQRL